MNAYILFVNIDLYLYELRKYYFWKLIVQYDHKTINNVKFELHSNLPIF